MDDPLLVRVLDGVADLDKKFEAILGGKIVLIAVVCDRNPSNQFHDKVGATGTGGQRSEGGGEEASRWTESNRLLPTQARNPKQSFSEWIKPGSVPDQDPGSSYFLNSTDSQARA